MNSLTAQLDIPTDKVSDFRAVLSKITREGHFGEQERLKVSKHGTIDDVVKEVQEFMSFLNDSDETIYGLVIEDLAPDDEEDGFSAPLNVHRLRLSRQQAIGMAA